ncbi:hypothetical protein C0991_010676 [Blastosporella zonata]|nr:hypothetical protein C0991_010676 [Blastosporella zonata]
MDSNELYSTEIYVIPPNTPPTYDQDLPQFDYSQTWSTPSFDALHRKDNLSLHIPQPYQVQQVHGSPYLSSPASPSSSTRSMSPGGLAAALGDFSLSEPWSGEEARINDSYPWATEQDVHLDSTSISSRDRVAPSEGLHLTIPVGVHDFDTFHLTSSSAISEEESNELLNSYINFDDSFHILDYDTASSQSSFESYPSPPHGDSPLNFSVANHSPIPQAATMLEGTDLLSPPPSNSSALQRRHSQSCNSGHRATRSVSGTSSFMPSLERGGVSKHQRRHSHSHGIVNNSIMEPDMSHSPLLSPTLAVPNNIDGSSHLQRRHSHSPSGQMNGGSVDQPLRRSRSSTSLRNRSPYARPLEIEPADVHPNPNSEGHLSPRNGNTTPEHSASPSPRPRNALPESDDMFRRYDNASGIGYPILQRDTIASDAVLQASAKRRKKAANYECPTCGQMLTSRDNLNSIRRHRCDYCHERFRTRSVLKRHQKSIKCPASRLGALNKKEPI